jgi:hypothetical protein
MTAAKRTTLESLARLVTKASSSADKKFTALAEDIAAVEKRFDARLDKLDVKMDKVESNLVAKIDRLDTKLTKFEESVIAFRNAGVTEEIIAVARLIYGSLPNEPPGRPRMYKNGKEADHAYYMRHRDRFRRKRVISPNNEAPTVRTPIFSPLKRPGPFTRRT